MFFFLCFICSCFEVRSLPVHKLSLKWRNWTYHKTYAIPPQPRGGPGLDKALLADVPTVYELPHPASAKYAMSYIIFDGTGYHSCLALSNDLLTWDLSPGVTFDRSDQPGAFDYGGLVAGGYIYDNYTITAPRTLAKVDGYHWQLYGAYASRAGYESGPGANGIAFSSDGVHWNRSSTTTPAVGPSDLQLQQWENKLIYQPFVVVHDGVVYDFYNAATKATSQETSGISWIPEALFPGNAGNATEWARYPQNPVLANGPPGSHDSFQAGDPKVFWDPEQQVWTMFYFGGGGGQAVVMVAFSVDLVHWEKDPEPLYAAGGNPWGLDGKYAHKVSVIFQQESETFFMFYTAVDKNNQRGIALLTSKPIS